jgi:hypothetical protein
MSHPGFVWVRLADAAVKVPLVGVEHGADLIKAAYLELGLDKKGLALIELRLFFCAVDGARGDVLPPLCAGSLLPSSGSILEADMASALARLVEPLARRIAQLLSEDVGTTVLSGAECRGPGAA